MSLFTSILHTVKEKLDATNAYKVPLLKCIYTATNITLVPDNIISLKESTVTLRVHHLIKMELLLKKDTLIKEFQKQKLSVTIILVQ